MTKPLLPAVALCALALAGCQQQKAPKVLDTNPDPMANDLAHAKPVELPPAMKATVEFRCKDNSLVSVTFFQGDKQTTVIPKNDAAIKLTSDAAGGPWTSTAGDKLSGGQKSITWTAKGKPALTCTA
jgi:hypothetical protein